MASPTPRALNFIAVLAMLAVCVAGQNFVTCVTSSSGTTMRTPGQPDFNFWVSRSLHPIPQPGSIAEVFSTQDVQAVVNCANQYNVNICPRSGGHSFVGSSLCSGVVLDVRQLTNINFANNQVTFGLGTTLGDLFYQVMAQSGGSRIIGVGLCPSVGTGGYVLGGGHNPYSGLTGLTCDSLAQIKIVLPNGDLVTATASSNSELFWASCGGGGSAFGIAVEATLNTHAAGPFNNNVFFRYTWPLSQAGNIIHSWMDWNQDNGNTWMRLEVNINSDLQGYGVCWNAGSTDECEGRLSQQAWFNTAGRSTSLLYKATRAQQFQAFIGPAGNWANNVWQGSDIDALTAKRDLDAGNGPNRLYSSSFWSWPGGNKPSPQSIQSAVNAVANINSGLVEWVVLQFNPWKGNLQGAKNNAFAHRGSNAFTELIGQSKAGSAGITELKNVEGAFKSITRPWLSGIYVSYPEFGLAQQDWQYLYWGQNLQRLASLRANLDPNGRMVRLQGLPAGTVACPGNLAVSSSGNSRTLAITGYTIGQMAGMVAIFSVNGGCGVNTDATQGANVFQDGEAGGNEYKAVVHSNGPFTVFLTGGSANSCTIGTVKINSVACGGNPTTCTDKTAPGQRCAGAPGQPEVPWLGGCCEGECAEDANKGWGKWCPEAGGQTNPPSTGCPKTPPGQRCAGAPGFPEVPWKGGCCDGACEENPAKGWGKWCPDSGTCSKTPPGQRCAGAAGQPEVPWLGGCCVGDCVEDPSKGWGKWCPESSGSSGSSCAKTPPGQRCAGAPGQPEVPWLGGCCVGDCVENPSKGWGKWCPE